MNIVCFHNPNEDNGYLSNWYPSPFTVDGVAFSSMEQFMMYRKAICFGDEAVAAQILSTSDVAEIKLLGRQVSNYDESMWNGIRQIVVYEGLLAKFSQKEELKTKLKATGNAVLAECAVKDHIWGIGLSMKDPDRLNKAKWNGQNLLGYALMMVRERLQQDYSWEQRKLSNYLEVSNEKNTNDVYGKQDVLSVSGDYGIVNQIEFQGRSFAGASVSNYGVVHTDDIVYTKSPLNANPYGIIKTNKGKTGIVSTLYAVYHPKKGTNSDFVQTYFEQHARMNNYMHPLVNKGAKNDMKVSAENALKGYVSFPNYEEQKAIAEAFSIIDCLITLHQRELYKHLRYRILKVRRKS